MELQFGSIFLSSAGILFILCILSILFILCTQLVTMHFNLFFKLWSEINIVEGPYVLILISNIIPLFG